MKHDLFLVSFLAWLKLLIENDLNGCNAGFFILQHGQPSDPKHFFQITWSVTIRAPHVRPHVHLQKTFKSLPLWWTTTQLWLFYSFVIVVLCESMYGFNKKRVFCFEHVPWLHQNQRFFQAPPLPNVLRQVRLTESSLVPISQKLLVELIQIDAITTAAALVIVESLIWCETFEGEQHTTTTTTIECCFFESAFTELESRYASRFFSFFNSNIKAESFIKWFTLQVTLLVSHSALKPTDGCGLISNLFSY